MATIIEKLRGKKKKEEFTIKTVFDRLEEEGFKPLIKSDILEKRVREMKMTYREVINALNTARTDEERGIAVDKAHSLVFFIASPWLRSMENPWLANKINDFCEQWAECRAIPAFLDMLVVEAKAIINLSFANLDVEPLHPIILTALSQRDYYPPWQMPTWPTKEGEKGE